MITKKELTKIIQEKEFKLFDSVEYNTKHLGKNHDYTLAEQARWGEVFEILVKAGLPMLRENDEGGLMEISTECYRNLRTSL